MGGRYVEAVVSDWTHLSDRRYRILLRMAAKAWDEDRGDVPAGTYWGGHEYLAQGLRPEWPEDSKARRNLLREVRREIAGLIDDKAVEVVETTRKVAPGYAQTYRLTFPPQGNVGGQTPYDSAKHRGSEPPNVGGLNHQRRGSDTPNVGGLPPSQLQEPPSNNERTTGAASLRSTAAEDEFDPGRPGRCPECNAEPGSHLGTCSRLYLNRTAS